MSILVCGASDVVAVQWVTHKYYSYTAGGNNYTTRKTIITKKRILWRTSQKMEESFISVIASTSIEK